jgi:hypothetical protein
MDLRGDHMEENSSGAAGIWEREGKDGGGRPDLEPKTLNLSFVQQSKWALSKKPNLGFYMFAFVCCFQILE